MDLKALTETAAALFTQHQLIGWTFALSRAKRRLGVCKHRSKRIEIGEYYARHNPDAGVLDTLLHEIAHALAGPGAGHGPKWKAIAVRIGATPQACDRSPDTVIAPGDWQVTCTGCNRTYHRYKRPPSQSRYQCRCPARSSLVFAYVGDPSRKPPEDEAAKPTTGKWQAKCPGCGIVHRRVKRPRSGVWRCRCVSRSEIKWTSSPGGLA